LKWDMRCIVSNILYYVYVSDRRDMQL